MVEESGTLESQLEATKVNQVLPNTYSMLLLLEASVRILRTQMQHEEVIPRGKVVMMLY